MSVDLNLETRRGDDQRRIHSRSAAALWAELTRRPRLAPESPSDIVDDPLAGEDEQWAEEEVVLWTPDTEDYVGFLRSLWLTILAGAVFWIALVLGAIELFSGIG